MRNNYKHLILAASLFLVQATVALAQAPLVAEEELIGTWLMDAHTIVGNMGERERAAFDSLPDFPRERFVQTFGSRRFEFGKSGDFSASWEADGRNHSAQGRWLSEGEGRLSVVFPTGTSEYKLDFPSAGRMQLEPLNSSGGMVKTLFFIKSGEL